ncbi:MAG TPA: fibronectin type III domain-containing protein, partial [Thermoclostridium sp.]|nr:fibronectin type III domain-containing protein [Thermoclostridium sp.]
IMSIYEMPSLLGKNLDYSKELTINEGMKCLFDIIPYEYGNANVYENAVRAGFLLSQFSKSGAEPLSTEQAIYAAVKVLNRKIAIDVNGFAASQDYEDIMNTVGQPYKDAVAFTVANGIISNENGVDPSSTITLSKFLEILERILIYAGEI